MLQWFSGKAESLIEEDTEGQMAKQWECAQETHMTRSDKNKKKAT